VLSGEGISALSGFSDRAKTSRVLLRPRFQLEAGIAPAKTGSIKGGRDDAAYPRGSRHGSALGRAG